MKQTNITDIKRRGLYIFYPLFKDQFHLLRDFFLNSDALYARAVHIHEQVIMARVRHSKHHFCLNYESKLNSTQNSDKNYKKFMNSKGPR